MNFRREPAVVKRRRALVKTAPHMSFRREAAVVKPKETPASRRRSKPRGEWGRPSRVGVTTPVRPAAVN
jgi:hypothetical protein